MMGCAQVIEFLKTEVPLFDGFSDDRLEELAKGSRLMTFEPNEAVVEFGDEGRFLGVLIDGSAEVSVTDEANAADISTGFTGHIDRIQSRS